MSKVVSLNKVRKHKARADAEQQAAQNRIKFGRTSEQKKREAAELEAQRQKLDRLKRERPDHSDS